jgi:glycosyltransferase involved in cell wall biosynthesis
MRCGAAVIATDIGGHRGFSIDGETARLVPPKAPDALAAAIMELIADPAIRIGLAEQAHRHISQFSWERASGQLEGLFSELKR